MYKEVTEITTIKLAQKDMAKNLERHFPHKEQRTIGWPAGHFKANVRFANKKGEEVSWWYGWYDKDRNAIYNLFGRGDPGTSKTLFIDLQFNLPLVKFNRTQGGVFLRDIESGMIILGHRGIVTRGKSRVPRDVLLQEANVATVSALSDVRPGNVDILLVTPVLSRSLGNDITEFAIEVRRAAYLVMDQNYSNKSSGSKVVNNARTAKKSPLDVALTSYYDEFTGKTTFSRKSRVIMNCRHGEVVKALRDKLQRRGRHYKSVAMDLVVETKNTVFLYEVKTGANTQSIYTGIGQLYFHAAALARKFPSKKVIRTLVLPYEPSSTHRKKVCEDLGIEIMTFKMATSKVVIH